MWHWHFWFSLIKLVLDLATPEGCEAELNYFANYIGYRDGIAARRRSPISVIGLTGRDVLLWQWIVMALVVYLLTYLCIRSWVLRTDSDDVVDVFGTKCKSIYIRNLRIGRLRSNRIRIESGLTIRIRIESRIESAVYDISWVRPTNIKFSNQ